MREKQITFAARQHQLTNINVWTADSQWLAFDLRPSGASFTSQTIERVNVMTGEVEVLYQAQHGAHVGVVTVGPDLPPRYVCIHGPGQSRRSSGRSPPKPSPESPGPPLSP